MNPAAIQRWRCIKNCEGACPSHLELEQGACGQLCSEACGKGSLSCIENCPGVCDQLTERFPSLNPKEKCVGACQWACIVGNPDEDEPKVHGTGGVTYKSKFSRTVEEVEPKSYGAGGAANQYKGYGAAADGVTYKSKVSITTEKAEPKGYGSSGDANKYKGYGAGGVIYKSKVSRQPSGYDYKRYAGAVGGGIEKHKGYGAVGNNYDLTEKGAGDYSKYKAWLQSVTKMDNNGTDDDKNDEHKHKGLQKATDKKMLVKHK